jgi:enterochelin esterase family protein
LNSPAQGNYSDYVLDEVIPLIEKRYESSNLAAGRIIAGHSSGGFGALRLAMMRPDFFQAVVALSPDTDLEVTHRHMVMNESVKHVSQRQLRAYAAPRRSMVEPSSGLIQMILGLSAAYAPKGPDYPGQFHWPFDEQGRWRDEVWGKWLEQDPVVIARKTPDVFPSGYQIYLDGAEHDSFGAQKGARALRDAIVGRTKVEFYESPGGHSDHVASRFARGLEWVHGAKPRAIR